MHASRLLQVLSAAGVLLAASVAVQALSPAAEKAIADRIKPVGEVCIEGDAACAGTASAAGGAPRSGDAVYNGSCMACHGSGAGGAPKTGDKGAWAPRIAQGLDKLVEHAVGGFKGMPAKGLCMNCSDDEIKAAVEYMVKNSK
jgi:cytochrome c5